MLYTDEGVVFTTIEELELKVRGSSPTAEAADLSPA